MHLYSTSLLFCFIQGLIYVALLCIRAQRNERLSDYLLAFIVFSCCLEIIDYMLGFMGINILWEQLEFFPRNVGLLIGPACYFYLLSQTNHQFKFRQKNLVHLIPFALFTAYHLIIFSQGHYFVLHWETTVNNRIYFTFFEKLAYLISNYFYLFLSLRLYFEYRKWAPLQFSDIDSINYEWFRNFMIALTTSITINWLMELLNSYFSFSFYQNWWGKLATGVLIYYLSISGYGQKQDKRNSFIPLEKPEDIEPAIASPIDGDEDIYNLEEWNQKLVLLMKSKKLYLKPEFSLSDLAYELNTNISSLSYIINKATGKNFNDFINGFRIEEFELNVLLPQYRHYSLTGIAYECGFNSKATFYRAFKKTRGVSPSALIKKLSEKTNDNEQSQESIMEQVKTL